MTLEILKILRVRPVMAVLLTAKILSVTFPAAILAPAISPAVRPRVIVIGKFRKDHAPGLRLQHARDRHLHGVS